ncbi:MAG: hypothetical protein K2I21_11475, partial [Acetatifactor sp.]|nr:hypothetical protein [Acetatifactor sp.]
MNGKIPDMYKRCISVCIMLLLSIQMLGCKYIDGDENVETGVQLGPGEIFDNPIRSLSGEIYFYQDKLYIDVGQTYAGRVFGEPVDGNVRLVYGKQGEDIVLLDTLELSSTWDRKTLGTGHYLVSGDESERELWIYDLDTGDAEKIQVGENQKIHCWDVENGKVFYSIKTQKTDTDIINEIVIRDLEKGKEEVITLEEQIERIHRMSVNSKEEIGIFYWNADSAEDHLGIIRDGQCTEIDTSNVEIWE